MTKTKSTKRAFISSLLMLSLCFTMLVGTTFAWYTDSVTSSGNKIIAGTLDIQLWKYNGTSYEDISASAAPIFKSSNYATNSTATLWEPGKTQIAYLKIVNGGDLWLKYQVALEVYNVSKNLYKAMRYEIVPDAQGGSLDNLSWTTLGGLPPVSIAGVEIPDDGSYTFGTTSVDVPMAPGDVHYFALAIHMDEEAGNEYMNGEVDFDLKVLATQQTAEFDSFNNQYDAQSAYPEIVSGSAVYSTTVPTTVTAGNTDNVGAAKVTIPAGTAYVGDEPLADNENVNLYVEETDTPANFEVESESNGTTTYEVGLETDSGAKITSSGGVFTVDLNIGVVDLEKFAHNGVAMIPGDDKDNLADGEYFYDQSTGIITFKTTSFSPFTSEYLFDGGLGTKDYPYLIATAAQWNDIRTAEYFKLVDDIDFKGTAPTAKNGYSSSKSTIILGDNHVIKNISGSLFTNDWLYNLVMKDLTIKNSYADTALIGKYGAYSSNIGLEFDNVDIEECTSKGGSFFLPWVYDNYNVSFKNCDVKNSSLYDNRGQGFGAAFAGNSKANVVVDSCSLTDVYIESNQYRCGAFIGNDNGNVRNSTVNVGTLIVQKNNGLAAYAIGAAYENCEFYGTIKTEKISQAVFQGFESTGVWSEITPSVVGSDFVIGTDGTVTYNGTGSFSTVKVYQKVNIDRLFNGEKENGGFPYQIGETTTFTNVSNGTEMVNAIPYITAFKNVAPEYSNVLKNSVTSLPAGLSFSGHGFAIDNGTAYLDASEGESSKRTDYVTGTHISSTVTKTRITVFFAVYDANDTLVSVASNTYDVII